MPFTEQEERFIAQAIEVLHATYEYTAARDDLDRITAEAHEVAKLLGATVERTYELMQEALERAGYEPGSPLAKTISEAYDEALAVRAVLSEIEARNA